MINTYAGHPSTRYRDLVDLVLIAPTQIVDACSLHTALVSEHRLRETSPATIITLPSEDWHDGYHKLAVAAQLTAKGSLRPRPQLDLTINFRAGL